MSPATREVIKLYWVPRSRSVRALWILIDEAVAKGPWILGERFSAADVMIGGDLFFWNTLLKILQLKPASAAHVARCTERPAFRKAQALNEAGA